MSDTRGYGSFLMYNEIDPFVVRFQRAPAFGIESISVKTKEEAFHYAMCMHLECVGWVEVINQNELDENEEHKIVFTRKETEKASDSWCQERGIKSYYFGVSVSIVNGEFVSEITRL